MSSCLDIRSHVVFENRSAKAKKIEKILGCEKEFNVNQKLLEVGTGSGGIASYFASKKDFSVYAVDVVDNCQLKEGYEFQLVFDARLPFTDNFFDIVISNHVIEHVGDKDEQKKHLEEIYRVLKTDGILYLAVPNRWMLIEPHYKLIFLSWLPRKYRSLYLKKIKNIDVYDCEPLEKYELESLLTNSSFRYKNYCVEAMNIFVRDEKGYQGIYYIFKWIPLWFLKKLVCLIPTLIYLAKK